MYNKIYYLRYFSELSPSKGINCCILTNVAVICKFKMLLYKDQSVGTLSKFVMVDVTKYLLLWLIILLHWIHFKIIFIKCI